MGSLKDRHKWYTVIERPIWPIEAHSIVKCKSKMFESTYRTHYPEVLETPKMSNVHLTWFLLEPQKKTQPLNHNPQESAGILGAEDGWRDHLHTETKLEENSLKSLKRYTCQVDHMEPKKCCFANGMSWEQGCPISGLGGCKVGPTSYEWSLTHINGLLNE